MPRHPMMGHVEPQEIRYVAVRAGQRPYPIIGFLAVGDPVVMGDVVVETKSRAGLTLHRVFKLGKFENESGTTSEYAIMSEGAGPEYWKQVDAFLPVAPEVLPAVRAG